jgi:ornithine cyclodeaminase/alanine dehydrogenase
MNANIIYLSRADVEAVGLGMAAIIGRVGVALEERGAGRSEMPPKPGVHPGGPDNFLHAMSALLPGLGAVGMKWVGGFPGNPGRGLPYITGLLVLNDLDTGLPVAVMDCAWITAMRTAAATAIASRHLGRPDPESMAILGCGVQGRTNLEAVKLTHPDLRRVSAFDILPDRTRIYIEEMRARYPEVEFTSAPTPRQALSGADIIVTAGPILKDPRPEIEPDWVAAGALGVALDYDSYWKPAAMHAMDRFVTDDTPQLLHTRTAGYFGDIPDIDADLGDILTGRKPGRRAADERILCMNLGLAIYDIAVGHRLLELARERGLGTKLPI